MHTFHRSSRVAAIVCATAFLAACGGGGGSSPTPGGGGGGGGNPTPTPTPTGSGCSSVASSHGLRMYRRAASGVLNDRLYVKYRAPGTAQTIDAAAGAERGISVGTAGGIQRRIVMLPPTANATTVAARLRTTASVVGVYPVHARSAMSVSSPNDPIFQYTNLATTEGDQWYLYKTAVTPTAWSIAQSNPSVGVAIIDTGVDETNQDLYARLTNVENIVAGVDTIGTVTPSDRTAQDSDGHGTNVAGIMDATTNNGYGFAGVAFNAGLQAYQIFPPDTSTCDEETAATSDEVIAIGRAIANGASVINLSLGGSDYDQGESDEVEAAIAAGVTVVAAAGNEYGSPLDYPAGYNGVIAVGASNVNDNNSPGVYDDITGEGIASYSNYGATLLAPGGDPSSDQDLDLLHWIENYSTTTAADPSDRCSNTDWPPQTSDQVCRALFAGTSQATPQVSGTVALMEAYHGGARSLTPAQVLAILQANSDSIGLPTSEQGAGRLDAGKAVAAAHP